MRLLEALSRTGTRKRLVEHLLDAQDGPRAEIQRGMDPSAHEEPDD